MTIHHKPPTPCMQSKASRHAGFTLIELITVMVVVALIASFSSGFVVSSMKSAASVTSNNRLLSKSRLSTDYMVRRLRNALPYSVRILNDGQCLQFMPIVSSGLYLNLLPSVINGAFAIGSITPISVSPFVVNGGSSDYLAVAANSHDEIYGLFPSSLAAIASHTSTDITLVSDKQWLRNSINQRFYVVESPSAFCLVNNELRLYRSLSIADTVIDTSETYDLLSDSVAALSDAFAISSAVEDRNIRISLSFLFTENDHRLEAVKQVVIRNVP